MKAHFNALRNGGCTVSQVDKSIKAAKAIFTYAFDLEYVTSNVMQRYPKLQRVEGEAKANRGVFTEAELQAVFATATAFELALFGTLSMTGPRPGKIYALDWSAVYLDVEKPYFRIERTWCSKGFRFYAPKTEAGRRTVPISVWLAFVLREHRARSGGVGLVFPSAASIPLNKANVRKRVWAAGVSERVAERVGLTLPTPSAAHNPPTAPRQPPKLRMIEGGRRAEGSDQRDIRRT